jgi:hypothetical protein
MTDTALPRTSLGGGGAFCLAETADALGAAVEAGALRAPSVQAANENERATQAIPPRATMVSAARVFGRVMGAPF